MSKKEHFWIPEEEVKRIDKTLTARSKPRNISFAEHGAKLSNSLQSIKKSLDSVASVNSLADSDLLIFSVELPEGEKVKDKTDLFISNEDHCTANKHYYLDFISIFVIIPFKKSWRELMERKIGAFTLTDFYAARKQHKKHELDGISALIRWERIENFLRKKLKRGEENAAGVQAYPALVMFKVLLLQAWYNLSDYEMEAALCDRISFARFTGFSLEDETPDHSTICRFRNRLVEQNILHKLLDEVNKQLQAQGKFLKKGCIVDATIISSAARPVKQVDIESVPEDRAEENAEHLVSITYSKDADAAWVCKGNKFHYGHKLHVATDAQHGFIVSAHATPANRSDTLELERVVAGAQLPSGARVYADKGYASEKNRTLLRRNRLKDGIMSKAARQRPLSARQKQRNRLISSVRGLIERGFGTLKRGYGLARASYLGTAKVEAEFLLAAIAFNLKKALFLSPA